MTPGNTDTNPVHRVQQDLAEAFGGLAANRADQPGGERGFLAAALASIGWLGTTRQSEEAKPYLQPLDDINQLRATLYRLGIESRPLPFPAHCISAHHLPCLIVSPSGEKLLVLDVVDEDATVISDTDDQPIPIAIADLEGEAWQLRLPSHDDTVDTGRTSWVRQLLKLSSRGMIEALIVSCGINILTLMGALFVMAAYDFAIPSSAFETLAFLAFGALLAIAAELQLRRFRARAIARLVARFDALIATATFAKVLSLPLSLTENLALGTQLARLRQFRLGQGLFAGNVASAAFDIPFTILSLSLMLWLGGSIAAVPICAAACLGIIFLMADPSVAEHARQVAELRNRFDNLQVEIATKHETIRDAGLTARFAARSSDLYLRYLTAKYRAQSLEVVLQSWSQAIVGATGIAVLGLGAMRVLDQSMSTGALIAIMAVVWRVMIPVQTVCLSLQKLRQSGNTLRQIDQLMKLKSEGADIPSSVAPRRFKGALSFSDVSVRYTGRSDFALRGVSLDVTQGSLFAITGASGAGKSTLLKTAIGLYLQQGGRVSIDGLDMRQLDPRELRQAAYYLAQEPVMFFGTIEQNIRLAAPTATDDEILAALDAFGIRLPHPLLPEGLKTRVGGWIRSHSAAGLMQRIALASAFVQPRPLLLLDDPVQHLDGDGDRHLIEALLAAKRRSTILMVTKRPSHMELCDSVVVMNNGEIVLQGSPAAVVPRLRPNNPAERAA